MISSNDLSILILTMGLIALVLGVRYLVVMIYRKAWSDLAEHTGLAFSPGDFFGRGLSLSGIYRSYLLSLDVFNSRSGRTSSTYTRIILPLRTNPELSLWLFNEVF